MNKRKVILYVSLYKVELVFRHKEIEYCLKKNLENKYFDQIVILNEGFVSTLLDDKKLKIIKTNSRPTFQDIFNNLESECINVIANNDIWFDCDFEKLKYLLLSKNDFLCLTRRESDGNLLRPEKGDTQDVWIMIGRPRLDLLVDFYLGIPGCDNRLAFVMFTNGYRVLNPSRFIIVHHCHNIYTRTSSIIDRVASPYFLSRPIGLFEFYLYRLFLYLLMKNRILHIRP